MAKQIIAETTSLLLDNKVFMLKLVALLHISPLFLLVLLHSLVSGPLLQKVEDAYEASPSSLAPEDVRSLVTLELPFFLAFSFLCLSQIATTVSAAASAYSNDSHHPLDLKVFLVIWIKPKSKKVFFFRLFTIMIILLLVVFAAAASLILEKRNSSNAVLRWAIASVAAITYPYLASVCAIGLIISVLEESCLSAFQEACKLVNQGRKLQSYVLMTVLTLLSLPINVIFYVTSMDDDDGLTFVTGFPFILVGTSLFCLVNHFTFAVLTLFYFEIKRPSHHSVVREEEEEGFQLCTNT